MTVRKLAQQLSVGRSPIREAITAMWIQGMVDVRHGDGIYLLRRPEDLITSPARLNSPAFHHVSLGDGTRGDEIVVSIALR